MLSTAAKWYIISIAAVCYKNQELRMSHLAYPSIAEDTCSFLKTPSSEGPCFDQWTSACHKIPYTQDTTCPFLKIPSGHLLSEGTCFDQWTSACHKIPFTWDTTCPFLKIPSGHLLSLETDAVAVTRTGGTPMGLITSFRLGRSGSIRRQETS